MSVNTGSSSQTTQTYPKFEMKPLVVQRDDRTLTFPTVVPHENELSPIKSFEDILRALNPSGRWQIVSIGACSVVQILVGIAVYGQALLMVGPMDHTCVVYEDGTFGAGAWQANLTAADEKLAACISPITSAQCVKWNYTSPYYTSTMVSEWDLVCSRTYLRSLYQSMFLAGYMLGLLIFGLISDTIGRGLLIRCLWPLSIFHIAMTTFAPNFWVAFAAKVLHGFTTAGGWKASFVLVMELVIPEHRSSAATLICACWPVSGLAVAIFGYFFRDWRTLQKVVALVALTSFPALIWITESPRWLISQEKYSKARKILAKAARWNRTSLAVDELNLKALHNSSDSGHSPLVTGFRALFATKQLIQRTFILFLQWFVITHVNYGVTIYGIGVLPGNPYYTLGLMNFLRIVLLPLQFWVFKTVGHRGALFVWLWATAVSLAALGVCKFDNVLWGQTIGIILVSAGTAFIDFCFTAMYNLTGELYPTVSRQTALSACSVIGRVGGFTSPFVANMLGEFYRPLPALIFAGLCIVSSLPVFMLPRMEHAGLPETVLDTTLVVQSSKAGKAQHLLLRNSRKAIKEDGLDL